MQKLRRNMGPIILSSRPLDLAGVRFAEFLAQGTRAVCGGVVLQYRRRCERDTFADTHLDLADRSPDLTLGQHVGTLRYLYRLVAFVGLILLAANVQSRESLARELADPEVGASLGALVAG